MSHVQCHLKSRHKPHPVRELPLFYFTMLFIFLAIAKSVQQVFFVKLNVPNNFRTNLLIDISPPHEECIVTNQLIESCFTGYHSRETPFNICINDILRNPLLFTQRTLVIGTRTYQLVILFRNLQSHAGILH